MPGRLVMTSFGFRDAGGGTIVPRNVAWELVRRGWGVTVFYAGVGRAGRGAPYEIVESVDEGVKLVGVFNRPHGLLDLGHPHREIDDPPITAAFGALLDREKPDVVHFHNLHNLGAALVDQAFARGLPSYFSTHNYWLICARNYLFTGEFELCPGPGDRGGNCAPCVGSGDRAGYQLRLSEIRSRFTRGMTTCLAVSDAVKRTLVAAGYPDEMIDVVRQALPAAEGVWERLGRDRAPGRVGGPLHLGFFGSAYPHKGPQLLVEAAQHAAADVRVTIYGEVPAKFAERLQRMDGRGLVAVRGAFGPDDLPDLLAEVDAAVMPSMWWDCAPLMAAECLAGRVPLLAPRLGGIPEWVRDGRDGLLFDGRSAAGLTAAIDRLAGEEGLLERIQDGIAAPAPFAGYVDELEAYYRGERPSRGAPEIADGPAVRWIGDHTLNTSLSIVNREVRTRLHAAGDVGVQRVERTGMPLDPPLPHVAQAEVRHQWPPDWGPAPSGRLAVIQPWEFGAIPRDWVGPISDNVDELWVPSEYVRRMYVDSGIEADRVHVVPNGVDPGVMRPDGPKLALDAPGVRLLFVGGLIGRKGPDVLMAAYQAAFAGRDDVSLVVKDFGAQGVYRGTDREGLRAYAAAGTLPRVVLLEDELSDADMAGLYRACDVLVHPYRGEGFAMPVLEAMACGLPVVVTSGGPTDEFCPPEAGWRIRSERRALPGGKVDQWVTAVEPWMLEPDGAHLVELLREAAAADPAERERRGRAAAEAARALSWDAVAAAYRTRLGALLARREPRLAAPRADALELEGEAAVRILATPAWRAGDDRVGALLAAWAKAAPAGTDAVLHLLADSRLDGTVDDLADRVMAAAAAAGVDLEGVADIDLLVRPLAAGDDDRLLHAAVDAYVPLHPACTGHIRHARAAGNEVLGLDRPDVWSIARKSAARVA
jgi:glycosyltransferase involved in cell wall biosynthesis